MELAIATPKGNKGTVEVSELAFGTEFNQDLVHQTVVAFLAGARQGTRAQKNRSAVSGGEVGARFGPSLMPSGDESAWQYVAPIWNAIAAKVDSKTGLPIERFEPGNPVTEGEPCTTYIGLKNHVN